MGQVKSDLRYLVVHTLLDAVNDRSNPSLKRLRMASNSGVTRQGAVLIL